MLVERINHINLIQQSKNDEIHFESIFAIERELLK